MGPLPLACLMMMKEEVEEMAQLHLGICPGPAGGQEPIHWCWNAVHMPQLAQTYMHIEVQQLGHIHTCSSVAGVLDQL